MGVNNFPSPFNSKKLISEKSVVKHTPVDEGDSHLESPEPSLALTAQLRPPPINGSNPDDLVNWIDQLGITLDETLKSHNDELKSLTNENYQTILKNKYKSEIIDDSFQKLNKILPAQEQLQKSSHDKHHEYSEDVQEDVEEDVQEDIHEDIRENSSHPESDYDHPEDDDVIEILSSEPDHPIEALPKKPSLIDSGNKYIFGNDYNDIHVDEEDDDEEEDEDEEEEDEDDDEVVEEVEEEEEDYDEDNEANEINEQYDMDQDSNQYSDQEEASEHFNIPNWYTQEPQQTSSGVSYHIQDGRPRLSDYTPYDQEVQSQASNHSISDTNESDQESDQYIKSNDSDNEAHSNKYNDQDADENNQSNLFVNQSDQDSDVLVVDSHNESQPLQSLENKNHDYNDHHNETIEKPQYSDENNFFANQDLLSLAETALNNASNEPTNDLSQQKSIIDNTRSKDFVNSDYTADNELTDYNPNPVANNKVSPDNKEITAPVPESFELTDELPTSLKLDEVDDNITDGSMADSEKLSDKDAPESQTQPGLNSDPPSPSRSFPIFKTVENEDPESVLDQLKETEKKFNIKLHSVQDLEEEISQIKSSRSVSIEPNVSQFNETVYFDTNNIEGIKEEPEADSTSTYFDASVGETDKNLNLEVKENDPTSSNEETSIYEDAPNYDSNIPDTSFQQILEDENHVINSGTHESPIEIDLESDDAPEEADQARIETDDQDSVQINLEDQTYEEDEMEVAPGFASSTPQQPPDDEDEMFDNITREVDHFIQGQSNEEHSTHDTIHSKGADETVYESFQNLSNFQNTSYEHAANILGDNNMLVDHEEEKLENIDDTNMPYIEQQTASDNGNDDVGMAASESINENDHFQTDKSLHREDISDNPDEIEKKSNHSIDNSPSYVDAEDNIESAMEDEENSPEDVLHLTKQSGIQTHTDDNKFTPDETLSGYESVNEGATENSNHTVNKGSNVSNDSSISEASEHEMERRSQEQDFSELGEKLVEEVTKSNSVDTTHYEDAIDNDSIEGEAEEEKMGFGAQKSEADTSNEVPKGEFENIDSPKILEKSESIENHGVTESPKDTEDNKAAEVVEASPDAIIIPTDKFESPVKDSKIFLENTESHVESNGNSTKEEDAASGVELIGDFESAKPEEKYENLIRESAETSKQDDEGETSDSVATDVELTKQPEEQKGSDYSSKDSESPNQSRIEEANSIHESSSIEDLSENSSNNGQAHEVPTDKTYYESVDTDIRIEEPLENADQPFISYQDTTSVQMLDDVLIRPTNIVEPAEESTPEQLEGPPELNTHEAFDSNSEMIQPTNIVEPEELEEKIFATEIDPESVIFNDSASIIPTSVVEAVSLRGTPTIEDRKMEFDAEELPDRDQDSEASRESNRGIKRKSDVSPSNGSNVKKFKKSMFNPFSWFFSRTNERSHSAPSSAAAAEYNINHDEGFSRPISAPELEPVSSSNESSDSDIDVEESASDKDSASSENDRQESNDTDVGAEEKDHNDTENHMVVDSQKVTVLPPQSTEDDISDNDPKDLSIIHSDFKSEKPNDKTQHESEGQVEEHSSHEKQPIQEDIGPDQIGQEQIDQEQIDQEQIDQEQIDQEQIDSDFKQVEFENEHIDKGEHDFEQKQTVATEGNISTAEKGFVQNQTNNSAPKFQLASNADKEKEGVNPVEKDTTFLKATETNDEQLREIDDESLGPAADDIPDTILEVEDLPAEGITENSPLRSNEATENEKSMHEDREELQADQAYEGNDDKNNDHFAGPINSSQEVSHSSPVSVKANDEAAKVKGESGILNYLLELAKTKENDNEDEYNADEKEDNYVSVSKDTETSETQFKTDFDTDDKNEENRSETESVNSEIAAALLRVANEAKEKNEPLDFPEKDEIIKTEEQTDKVPEDSTGTSEKYTDDEKMKNKPEDSESAESGSIEKNDDGHFTALKAEDQIPDTPIKISDQEAQTKSPKIEDEIPKLALPKKRKKKARKTRAVPKKKKGKTLPKMQIPADRDFSNSELSPITKEDSSIASHTRSNSRKVSWQTDTIDHPAQRTRSKSPLKRSIRELSSDIEEGIVPIKKKRGRPKKVKNPDVDEKKKKQEQEVRGRGRKRD